MKRFGVSLEEDLLKELDRLVIRNRFPNRSQAIRHLIRAESIKEKFNENEKVSGCIILVYDHHKRDIVNKSLNIQHRYQKVILAVQHVHLDHNNCLETIAVKGKASELRDLADRLIALKGVKHGDLVISAID